MNNPGEFEGMEEATLKDLAFLSRSSMESDAKSGLMDVWALYNQSGGVNDGSGTLWRCLK